MEDGSTEDWGKEESPSDGEKPTSVKKSIIEGAEGSTDGQGNLQVAPTLHYGTAQDRTFTKSDQELPDDGAIGASRSGSDDSSAAQNDATYQQTEIGGRSQDSNAAATGQSDRDFSIELNAPSPPPAADGGPSINGPVLDFTGTDAGVDSQGIFGAKDHHGDVHLEEEEREAAPEEINLSSTSIDENEVGGTIGSVDVIDPNGDTDFTFTLSDTRFEIVDGHLRLKPGVALDHETSPTIMLDVTATDQSGLSYTQSFSIDVNDVNEQPHDILLSSTNIDENDAGAVVGTVSASDPDAGAVLSYSVSDDRFEVVGGQLKLKDGISLDHEAADTVALKITVTDEHGASETQAVKIAVADVNEGPTDLALKGDSIKENDAGAVVGTVSASDPDAGAVLSYSVSDDRFEVVGGQLKLKDGISLDHEAADTVELKITVTDEHGASETQAVKIAVADDGNVAATVDLNVVALDAPGTNGVAEMSFGTVSISNTGQSDAADGVGNGETALWSNVGTFQGVSFDMRATVVETNTSGRNGSFFATSGDDARVYTNAGDVTVKYEYFVSGTDEKMIINGSFLVDDLDGGSAGEGFTINVDEVDAYGVEAGGDIDIFEPDVDTLAFDGIGSTSSGDSTNAVAFNMNGSTSFTLTYSADTSGRAFYLNGNWDDNYFSNVTVTDTNLNHADVFTEGSDGTHVASEQISISDVDGTVLKGATVVLTNAQLDDQLTVGTLPGGITATVDYDVEGQITVTLTGSGSHEDYEKALLQIKFENDSSSLADVERNVEIRLDDGEDISEPAIMTVYVNELGGDGVLMDTGSNLVDDVLTGNGSDNRLSGLAGDDTISGEGGDDTLRGGDGDDMLTGGTGNDLIEGGDGTDTAHFSSDLSNYDITVDGNGDLVVTAKNGATDGTDTLVDVEKLQFGDGLYEIAQDPDTGSPVLTGPDGSSSVVLNIKQYEDSFTPQIALKPSFTAKYFDTDASLSSTHDIDWEGTPTATDKVDEIDYTNSANSFWDGGSVDTFGVQVTGNFEVTTAGTFDFKVSADDGARLFIDGVEVIDHDNLHGYTSKTGSVELSEGPHEVEVRYFENGGHAGLRVEWNGPDTNGYENLTPAPEMEVDTNETAAYSFDLTNPSGLPMETYIDGLPADTILMVGGRGIVSTGTRIDVTGEDLSDIEIAPPVGFVGTIEVEVTASVENDRGTQSESRLSFDLEVGEPNSGLAPSSAAASEPMPAAAASPEASSSDSGWVAATEASEETSSEGSEEPSSSSVMEETVVVADEQSGSTPVDTHETPQW